MIRRTTPSPFRTARGAFVMALLVITQPLVAQPPANQPRALPRLQTDGAATHLIVDGEPFICFAGEVHNSAASSSAYMVPVWDRLARLHLNTIILPVSWELIEPEEGRFDFRLVDDLIASARRHDMRLVLLWLATVKNAKATYAPAWVRADPVRFPRAITRRAEVPYDRRDPVLSVFAESTLAADAAAFARFMAHLAAVDPQHSVIAVQVENETGLLGDSRDRSPAAEAAWRAPVPAALIDHLVRGRGRLEPSLEAAWARGGYRRTGNWAEVFGNDWQADEIFMAWGMSRFVDRVAAAGKARLALPMYANAWLGPTTPDERAGGCPSGGPVPRVFDVWKVGAPHIDWLSPDIYVPDFAGWARAFDRPGNPLFVPEARFGVGNFFVTVGAHKAFGFSPYGINGGLPDSDLSRAYALLDGAQTLLAKAQARDAIRGFALDPGEARTFDLGAYRVTVRGQREALASAMRDMGQLVPAAPPPTTPQTDGDAVPEMGDPRPSGMIVQLAPDELLVIGKDLEFSFRRRDERAGRAELSRVEEGRFVDGAWVAGRVLNGDERWTIVPPDRIGMAKLRLLALPAAAFPAPPAIAK